MAFGPLLDATGSFSAIWSGIPIGVVRYALLELIRDQEGAS